MHVLLQIVYECCEYLCREGHTFLMDVTEVRAVCDVKLYVQKAKNTLVKSVHYIMEYTICGLVQILLCQQVLLCWISGVLLLCPVTQSCLWHTLIVWLSYAFKFLKYKVVQI
jgi:hypothetical protein